MARSSSTEAGSRTRLSWPSHRAPSPETSRGEEPADDPSLATLLHRVRLTLPSLTSLSLLLDLLLFGLARYLLTRPLFLFRSRHGSSVSRVLLLDCWSEGELDLSAPGVVCMD